MSQPLISVIVPTKNSADTLGPCLQSIHDQSYPDIELIVVDNNSTDDTKRIAATFTPHVYNKGPERSAQRNYGAKKSQGSHVLFIDSDMELTQNVVRECAEKAQADTALGGIIIPEESFGEGFWAQCKRLERSFYDGVDWMEAARFFDKSAYRNVGGYDESMISGEDWDMSQRVAAKVPLARVQALIRHNEGRLKLSTMLAKKIYYARSFHTYMHKHKATSQSANQTNILRRYGLFFRRPKALLRNPVLGLGMLFMKTCEFGAGGVAFLASTRKGGDGK